MGYLHIDNLYKNQTILMFKECYALEKIHGTSAHINWNAENKLVTFFSGGENNERFVGIFNHELLQKNFNENFIDSNVVIYGEAYGGKQQGMGETYGKQLMFVGFDVRVGGFWLSVPNAENVCSKLDIEFVSYQLVKTDLDTLNNERDKRSIQAVRNGIVENKLREGVVLRPLIELTLNNGKRVIAKHKADEFKETKTSREVNPEKFKILLEANAIADEWVTEMRLKHVLDKLPQGIGMEGTKSIIDAMVEDVYREAKGEIKESREVAKAIGKNTAIMFKRKLQKQLEDI